MQRSTGCGFQRGAKITHSVPGCSISHIINRGNYRRDVFATVGATQAFKCVMDEPCRRFDWRLHAYMIMRNHFHFALETPQPNLTEGMHWLQSLRHPLQSFPQGARASVSGAVQRNPAGGRRHPGTRGSLHSPQSRTRAHRRAGGVRDLPLEQPPASSPAVAAAVAIK
jgi:REP element-mobilizing transposase RayT